MKVSGILFDKDGTLVDFNAFWIPAARRAIRRILSDYKIPDTAACLETALNAIGIVQDRVLPDSSFAWKTYGDIAKDLKPALEYLHPGAPVCVEELGKKLTRYFSEASFSGDQSVTGIGDLPSILAELRQMDIHLGVATTDTYHAAAECLKRLGILDDITFLAADQMPPMQEPMPLKPDGRILLRAAAQWKTMPNEILVVGDTTNDMKFAHNGGAIAVGVLSGVSSREDLRPTADYIMDSVSDLSALIRQLEQESL